VREVEVEYLLSIDKRIEDRCVVCGLRFGLLGRESLLFRRNVVLWAKAGPKKENICTSLESAILPNVAKHRVSSDDHSHSNGASRALHGTSKTYLLPNLPNVCSLVRCFHGTGKWSRDFTTVRTCLRLRPIAETHRIRIPSVASLVYHT
jgi:hypothetical protein